MLHLQKTMAIVLLLAVSSSSLLSQVIISQYYEGTSTNKWIELTNTGSTPINTASPQLKLGLWAVTGSTGNITFTGNASQTVNLTVTIPAFGSVLIGNTGNGTEVPYLNGSSAAQTSNSVINFNGNDGIALLDAGNNVIDRFGTGINATDISYIRNVGITSPNSTFVSSQWTSLSLSTVQTASNSSPNYLGFHIGNVCLTPSAQPSNLVFTGLTNVSVTGTFATSSAADEYLVLRSTSPTLTQTPVDGTTYTAGASLGNAVVQARNNLNTFTATGLTLSTTYYFFIYSIKSTTCNGGPKYRLTLPLQGTITTNSNCPLPIAQPSALTFTSVTSNSITGSFQPAATAEEYLVLRGRDPNITASPIDGILYTYGNTVGNYVVISRGPQTTFFDWGLDGNTMYFYKIYAAGTTNCVNGIRYRSSGPLRGYISTTPTTYTTLFGTLHSHSALSDGSGTVSGNLAYADAALCMDFLGISDHNHVSAGMSLSNWYTGVASAKAYSTSSFCALYGMEWGTISGGGHVVVYGTDSLLGWDPGNYNVFVPQNTYIGTGGLFNTINTINTINPNCFATLAHPNNTDFDDIVDVYNADAEMAVVGCAVENGPSTSTNTTYSDYPTSMDYLTYFRSLLARGYHVGPTIDHDNHNITHGRTAYSRTAVLSASINRKHIIEAFKQRRFYATEDCGALVSFTIDGFVMGNIMTGTSYPTINISANTSSPVASIKLFSGIPGSGNNATQLTSTAAGNLSYTHTALNNLSTRYYYADITEADGKRIITSPIWYTRNDNAIPIESGLQTIKPGRSEDKIQFSIYPNPASEQFTIQAELADRETITFSLYDLFGRLVLRHILSDRESTLTIPCSSFAKGLYTYTLQQASKGVDTGKLSIQ